MLDFLIYGLLGGNATNVEISNPKTDDNGNEMFQSYLSELFKKETG